MELLAEPLFWKVALTLAAPVCFVVGLRAWRRARLIEDTPTSRVRSAAQGYVELSGRGTLPAGVACRAPLSGRSCVWWSYRIQRKKRSGKNTHWETVNQAVSNQVFLLTDDTGDCLVNPVGAEVHPTEKSTWYGDLPWPAAAEPGRSRFGADYRYIEHRIYEHERIDVIGEFRTLGHREAADIEARTAALLREWKDDQADLLRRFDTDTDGILSQMEWEHARMQARREVMSSVAGSENRQPHLIAKPVDDRPFLLAACDLAVLARRYHWQGAAGLLGFVVLSGISAALWLA